VLVIVHHLHRRGGVAPERVHEGGDGPIAGASDQALDAVHLDRGLERGAPGVARGGGGGVADQGEGAGGVEIGGLEGGPDLRRLDLGPALLHDALDHAGELDLQPARQVQAVVELHDVGDPALAGLAIDPDHRFVAPAHVVRVDGEVGHLPRVVVLAQRLEALLDRVLVRAREGGVDEIAHVRVARVHRQPVAVLHRAPGGVDVGEVQLRVHALAEEVQRERDHVHVAGALAVAEERALDPIRARHHPQLGGGHRGAPVIVGVERQDDALALPDMAQEPLDLVGVDIGSRHLHGGGEIEDHPPVRRGLPHVHHRLADLHREVELGAGEALGRVLPAHVALGDAAVEVLAEPRRPHRDVHDAGPVQPEDDPALEGGGRVVEMDDGARRPPERLVGALDQLRPGLGEHLDDHVIGNEALLDELAHEVEVRLGGGGEAHLDLLEAALDQEVEHAPLPGGVHRVDERLVSVAQVHAAPPRSLGDHPGGPGAVRQRDGSKGAVVTERHRSRGTCLRSHGCVSSLEKIKKPP
jgi:hypothetical protein